MKKALLLPLSLSAALLVGCAPANITSAKWDTGKTGDVITRCEQVDMRSKKEMDRTFAKYDGWKMVYVSEYTTANRFGTDGVACFERAR